MYSIAKKVQEGGPMKIKDYFAEKRSRVANWYTQDTSDIPLYCKVTDKVLDMIVTLSDPREASLAVVDENNHVVGIVTGRQKIDRRATRPGIHLGGKDVHLPFGGRNLVHSTVARRQCIENRIERLRTRAHQAARALDHV